MADSRQTQQRPVTGPQNQTTTIAQYPLERRKIAKKITVAMLFWTITLGVCLIIIALLANNISQNIWIAAYILLGLYVIIFLIQFWYQNEYYKRYFYNIAPDFLLIKKGVIMPHETMLPYEKLQDVYMDQDLFDRMFGLWDVHVSTATVMSGYHAHIDGVNHDNADKLRELILSKIRKER